MINTSLSVFGKYKCSEFNISSQSLKCKHYRIEKIKNYYSGPCYKQVSCHIHKCDEDYISCMIFF